MNKTPKSKQNADGGSMMRLVVRWLFIGWWYVPALWLIEAFADWDTWHWTGDATEIYWHYNEDAAETALWARRKREKFILHNVERVHHYQRRRPSLTGLRL